MANGGQDHEKQEPGISDFRWRQWGANKERWQMEIVGGASSSEANPAQPSASALSWYYSARIQRMIEKRGEFSSELESEIESSKVHWSQLDPTSKTRSNTQHSREMDRKYLRKLILRAHRANASKYEHNMISEAAACRSRRIPESLSKKISYWIGTRIMARIVSIVYLSRFDSIPMAHVGLFRETDLVVGSKIAEGGQAEIYEACINLYHQGGMLHGRPNGKQDCVVKVFKAGLDLRGLAKQLPPGLIDAFNGEEIFGDDEEAGFVFGPLGPVGYLYGATLLKDERFLGRFAFVMKRCSGDLRKLIDQQMIQSNNQGPSFTALQVLHIMLNIACDMDKLHRQEPATLHRDLKAANILVYELCIGMNQDDGLYDVVVADYECSMRVVGTGFWRAPEILQQLKNRVPRYKNKIKFTKASDVYSFAMTCYELVTGLIPFADHPLTDYDLVLNGNRPELPFGLNSLLKHIITSCWHPNPSERPPFSDVILMLRAGLSVLENTVARD